MPFRWVGTRGFRKMGLTTAPNIEIREVFDRAKEINLCWHHIGVVNKRRSRFWETKEATRCTIDLQAMKIDETLIFDEIGMWSTNERTGPVTEANLRVGDRERIIPIVLRTGTIRKIFPIYNVPMTSNRTFLTGVHFLTHAQPFEFESGEYVISIAIRSGELVYAQAKYKLAIPQEGLEAFTLTSL